MNLFGDVLENRCLLTTVMNLDDSGFGSLRQAIMDTPSGGTVDFQPGLMGTITLMTGELLIDKDLTIAGPGAEVITVSGNHASRVLNIAANFSVAISGLTIADGNSQSGGGIFNSGTLSVTGSAVRGNTASLNGGGILNSGTLSVLSSTLSDNSAVGGVCHDGAGGGIFNSGVLTVLSSTFIRNTALAGGGIGGSNTLDVTNSTFISNSANPIILPDGSCGGSGGAILSGGMLTITGTTISTNTALFGGGVDLNGATAIIASSNIRGNTAAGLAGFGGGIDKSLGTLTITNSTVSGNSASSIGGGVTNFGTMTISNCAIKDNAVHNGSGSADGGGVFNFNDSMLAIADSTISGNTADRFGGGIITEDDSLLIIRSTISGNTAGQGGGIAILSGNGSPTTTTVQLLNSTVSGNTATGTETAGGIMSFTFPGSAANAATQLFNCTIADNIALGSSETSSQLFSGRSGSGYVDIQYRNTIISGDGSRPNFFAAGGGTFSSGGHNLIDDGTGGSGFTNTDLVGTSAFPIDPQLEPLGDYGGPTQTMRPMPGSPVINTGDNTGAPDTDQRGLPRIVLGYIDIGAVELQPSEFGGPGGSGGSGGSTAPGNTHPPRPVALASVLLSVSSPEDNALHTLTAMAKSVAPAERDRLDALFQTVGDGTSPRLGDWLSLFAGDGKSGKRAKDGGLLSLFDGETVGLLNEREGGLL